MRGSLAYLVRTTGWRSQHGVAGMHGYILSTLSVGIGGVVDLIINAFPRSPAISGATIVLAVLATAWRTGENQAPGGAALH